MTDYTKATGTGTMMIRDLGSTVEYWVTAGNNIAYNHGWVWTATGSGGTHNYNAGSGWNLMGSTTISSSQNVTFYVSASGSSGLGGPTTFTVWIPRATVPQAPTPISIDEISPTTMRYKFSGNGNGGAAILEWQIGYGTDPVTPANYVVSSGTTTLTGLAPGLDYYVWSRGRNAVGWGPWSSRLSAKTLAPIRIKDATGVYKFAIPYVKVDGVYKIAIAFVKDVGIYKRSG